MREQKRRLVNGYWVYDQYRGEPDSTLADNVMALALPLLVNGDDIVQALTVFPPERAANFTELELALRLEYLNSMDKVYVPRQFDESILFKIVALARDAIRDRDPRDPKVQQVILAASEGKEDPLPRNSDTGGGGELGIVLVGSSGVGKSSLNDRVLALFGKHPHIHQQIGGEGARWTQLSAVSVKVKTTWEATLVEILTEIDRQTGRAVLRKIPSNWGVKELVRAVKLALCAKFAPILLLDEFQRLGTLTKAKAMEILNGLIDIMEYGGIPVLVIGTVAVGELFKRFPMEMSKFAGAGMFEMPRMKREDPDTENLMSMFKEMSVSLTPVKYSDDFDAWFMAHTMGVRRFMRMAMKAVLSRHANNELIVADKALLDEIADDEMKVWQPAMSVLRKYELGFTMSFDDQDTYEHFFRMADTAAQTPAEEALQQEWLQKHLDDDGLISAEEYLILKARISADGLRLAEEDEAASAKEAKSRNSTMSAYERGKKHKAERDKKAEQNMDRVVRAAQKFASAQGPVDPEHLPD